MRREQYIIVLLFMACLSYISLTVTADTPAPATTQMVTKKRSAKTELVTTTGQETSPEKKSESPLPSPSSSEIKEEKMPNSSLEVAEKKKEEKSETEHKEQEIEKKKTEEKIEIPEITLPPIINNDQSRPHLYKDKYATDTFSFEEVKDITIDHDQEIVFAMLGSFTGHFQLYGELIRNGIRAHFYAVNEKGGIEGKKIRLICIDDKGSPTLSKKITDQLRKRGVSLILGAMGTRNILHNLRNIAHGQVTYLFPWGGDDKLRRTGLKHIVNGLGNLQPQLEAIVSYCVEGLLHEKIAIFHSDGNFNTEAKDYVVSLLKKEGITPVGIGSYNRFTMDILTPAQELIKTDPKIVICIANSMPTAKLISRFFELGHYGTIFIGIDSTLFVKNILASKGASYAYTSTVPDPIKSTQPIAEWYRRDMEAYFPEEQLNILSLSYYIHAHIITKALQTYATHLSLSEPFKTERFINIIEQMKNTDIGGFIINFNAKTREAYPHLVSIIKG